MTIEKDEPTSYDPSKNHDAISIIKQTDGNWIGTAWKFGRVVTAREIKPEDVLVKLMTHE